MYITQAHCAALYCFTWDETAAKGFDACVKKTSVEYTANVTKAGTIKTNVTIGSEGRCEYIDYEALKKGIATSTGSKNENRPQRS